MGKIRVIIKIINDDYDLKIFFTNSKYLSELGIIKNNYKLKKYINRKYKINTIKLGDILITPSFKNKSDLMFIRICSNEFNLLNICDRVIKLININEYKDILLNYNLDKYEYKYMEKILYEIVNKYIKKTSVNIDLIIN